MSRTLSNLVDTGPVTNGSSITTAVYTPTGFTAGDYVYYTKDVGYTAPPANIPAGGYNMPVGGKNFYGGLSQAPATAGLAGPSGVSFTFAGTTQTKNATAVASTTITASALSGIISANLSNGNIVNVTQSGTGSTGAILAFTIYSPAGVLVKASTVITSDANGSRLKGYAVVGHHNGTFLVCWGGGAINYLYTACFDNSGTPIVNYSVPFTGGGTSLGGVYNNMKMAVSSEGTVAILFGRSGNDTLYLQVTNPTGQYQMSPQVSISSPTSNGGNEGALIGVVANSTYTNYGGFIVASADNSTQIAMTYFGPYLATNKSLSNFTHTGTNIAGINGCALPDGSFVVIAKLANSATIVYTYQVPRVTTTDSTKPYSVNDITWSQITSGTVIGSSNSVAASATSAQFTPTISACIPQEQTGTYWYSPAQGYNYFGTQVGLVVNFYTNTNTLASTTNNEGNANIGISWSAVSTTTYATTPLGVSVTGIQGTTSVANGFNFPVYLATTTAYPTFSGLYTRTYTNGQTYVGVGLTAPDYIFTGVALTTASAGAVGEVTVNGNATLNSNYQSLAYGVSFDSTGAQSNAIGGNYGTVAGRNVTMKGSE